MQRAIPPSTTAISGTRAWTRKSEVDSPIAVVSALTIQKKAVISGTLDKVSRLPARLSMRCLSSICGGTRPRGREPRDAVLIPDERHLFGPGRPWQGEADLRPLLPIGGAGGATVG